MQNSLNNDWIIKPLKTPKIVGIDLFCGIGGMTNGLYQAGIQIKAGFDIDKSCRFSYTQKLNGNPEFVCKSIKDLTKKDVTKYFEEDKGRSYKLVVACPPCQPFSSYQKKQAKDHKDYDLFLEVLKILNWVKPEFYLMENVPRLRNDPLFQNVFLKRLKRKFEVTYGVENLADYGAPQNRKRLLLLGITKNFEVIKLFKNILSYF